MIKRRFLGEDNPLLVEKGFKRNLARKHLRAYLKGQTVFHYGKDQYGNPLPYLVQQEYYKV